VSISSQFILFYLSPPDIWPDETGSLWWEWSYKWGNATLTILMAVDYNDELSPFISIVKGDNPDYGKR